MSKKVRSAGKAVAKADLKITESLGERRDSPPVRAWSLAAKLGDQPELRLISAALVGAGLFAGDRRLSRAGVRMLLAHEIATLAKDFIKTRIDRTRPRSARGTDQAKPHPGGRTAKEHTSFPSGHSAGAVAVAQAFAREYPEHRPAALAAAGVIAVGQIPKAAHYPSDVAAGTLLGAAAEAVLAAAWPARGAR